jgi:hypothetical protein
MPTAGVEHDQERHHVFRRRHRRLHDEHVQPADVLVDPDLDLAVLELADRRLPTSTPSCAQIAAPARDSRFPSGS